MADRPNPARFIVLILILLALGAGVFARYGIPGRGVLTIRNDTREPIHIQYIPPASAASPIQTRLDPGQTVATTFRSGAVLEVWLGETKPDQPSSWRIDRADAWILINLEQFAFRLEGEGLSVETLAGAP